MAININLIFYTLKQSSDHCYFKRNLFKNLKFRFRTVEFLPTRFTRGEILTSGMTETKNERMIASERAKLRNNLIIGIDIRNIGKKRTGDEVVFLELVKNFAIVSGEKLDEGDDFGFKFLLFTDIADKKTLEIIEKRLGIVGKNNFKIISLKTPKKGGKFVWNFWTLPNYLRKNPVDIYHTQYITPFFVSRKTKIVTHIHDVSFKVYKQFIKWSDLFFLNILIPLSIRRADKIVAVSEFTKSEIEKYYPQAKGKVEVVYNAVAHKKPETKMPEKRELRAKYDLPEKYILYLGTLQPRKNISNLIEAYLKIADKISDTKLVIAGNLQAHNVDEKLLKYKNEKAVRFSGFIDEKDKLALLSGAEAFVYPSLYEGFGIPILEAMSVGTPVLASKIPPHREVAEEACLYFEPESLADLKNKLYTICVDERLRARLVNQGFSRASFFSWKKSAKKMLKIYKSLS